MSRTRTTKATVTFQDIEVTATKHRLWHVEAAGRSASALFLDQALDCVLPRLTYEELDSLTVQLLVATTAEPPAETAAGREDARRDEHPLS